MPIKPIQYESVLSVCTEHEGALELLRRYRPYLETVPSMRRPQDSIVTLPLPNVRVRGSAYLNSQNGPVSAGNVVTLPCDVTFLMCDPEWKVKTGVEIFVFIHRPQEDFSHLLMRWRQTQILLDQGYEWMLPHRYQHLLSDGANACHPLFVVFPQTPERIVKGLKGAALPVVIYPFDFEREDSEPSAEELGIEDIPGLEDIDASHLEIPDSEP